MGNLKHAKLGPDRFYAGIDDAQYRLILTMLDILRAGPSRSPSLREVELSDVVLILGEDVTNVAPRMALSLHQSLRQQSMQIAGRMRAAWMMVSLHAGPFYVALTQRATWLRSW